MMMLDDNLNDTAKRLRKYFSIMDGDSDGDGDD